MPDLTVEELGQLVRGTAAATWSFSNEGVSLQTAPWMELTGQTAEQMAGEGWLNVVNPADRDRVAAAWATSISHEQHFNTDYRILCADNVYRWFNVRGIPLRSAEGDVERWVGVLLEIPGTARFRDKVPTNIAASGDLSLTLRPAQLRAARASLNWSAVELAKRCGVSVSTIRRFEQEAQGSRLHGRSAIRIAECLQEAGVRITVEGDGSLGLTWSG